MSVETLHPKIMAEIRLAATVNFTSLHFGLNHMCCKHNMLFNTEHVESCDEISGCNNIRRNTRRMKEHNIRDWEVDKRWQAFADFASLAVQIKYQEGIQIFIIV